MSQRKYTNSVRLPKYRHHEPSGRAFIECKKFYGSPPRKYLKGAFNSAESKAHYNSECAKIAAWKVGSKKKPAPSATKGYTVTMLIADFLEWAESHYGAKNTDFNHFRMACIFLKRAAGRRTIRQLGPVRFKKVQRLMEQHIGTRTGKPWSRKYINAQMRRLKQVFAWAVENELMKQTRYAALCMVRSLRFGKTTAPELPKKQPVKWETVQQIFGVVPPIVQAMLTVHFRTGMREDEITAMRKCDIDTSDPTCWWYRPPQHKNLHRGKRKDIGLGPVSQEALRPYLNVAPPAYIFSPRIALKQGWDARRTKPATSQPNMKRYAPRYSTATYDHRIHTAIGVAESRLRKATGDDSITLERWTPHLLRHARATLTREYFGKEGTEAQLGNCREAAEIYEAQVLPLARRIAVETG